MNTTTKNTTAAILAEYKAAIRNLLKADLIEGEALEAWNAVPRRWVRRAEEAYWIYHAAHWDANRAWRKVQQIRIKAKEEGLALCDYNPPMLCTLQDHRAEIMDGTVEFDINFSEEAR